MQTAFAGSAPTNEAVSVDEVERKPVWRDGTNDG